MSPAGLCSPSVQGLCQRCQPVRVARHWARLEEEEVGLGKVGQAASEALRVGKAGIGGGVCLRPQQCHLTPCLPLLPDAAARAGPRASERRLWRPRAPWGHPGLWGLQAP